MRKNIIVKVDPQDSNIVERKYYEHASCKDNIAFLSKDTEVKNDLLIDYLNILDTRYYELEKSKSLISKKYCPDEIKGKPYDYSFDFEEDTITYTFEQ